jgi:RNA polymerase sigma-B factor
LRRSPSTADLAAELNLAPDRVREALACSSAYRAVSLDAVTPRGLSLRDTIPTSRDDVEVWETKATLATLVSALDRREQRLLHLRFVEEQTQTEIGQALGVSQMQVSRLLSALLRKLRAGMLGAGEPLRDAIEPRRAG